MTFGEKLQRLRKQSGLSQEQLALNLDVSRQAVSKWEQGDSLPDTDNIIKLSDIFDVSIDYLLKDKEVINEAVEMPIAKLKRDSKALIGICLIAFSVLSFSVVWILEKIYPAPIVFYNSATQKWKIGLDNFIWVHSLENFMLLLIASFLVGLLLIFRRQLKMLYSVAKEKLKR